MLHAMQLSFFPPLLLPLFMPGTPIRVDEVSLVEAKKNGAITISGQCLGGGAGDRISMQITNLTGRVLHTTIPAGWLMQNSDPEAQDLMIVDHVPVQLAPYGTSRSACRAYCVESGDRSPQEGTPFTSLGLARSTWVELAEYLMKNTVDLDDAQAAVWAVTNEHDIATISARNSNLRRFVADLTGREVPWYSKTYAPPTEEGQVFSDAPTTVQGEVDFALNTHGQVTALIHDDTGSLVYTIGKPRHLGPGTYTMEMSITVRGWHKGCYTISYYLDDTRLLKRMPFTV